VGVVCLCPTEVLDPLVIINIILLIVGKVIIIIILHIAGKNLEDTEIGLITCLQLRVKVSSIPQRGGVGKVQKGREGGSMIDTDHL